MNDDLTKIAQDSVNSWVIRLRQWLGYDIPQRWLDSLTLEIESACEKAVESNNEKWRNSLSGKSRFCPCSEPPSMHSFDVHCDLVTESEPLPTGDIVDALRERDDPLSQWASDVITHLRDQRAAHTK